MINKKIASLVLVAIISFSGGANAADLVCTGKVDYLRILGTAGVYVKFSWAENVVRICSLNNTWKDTVPQVCDKLVGMLETARITGGDVQTMYRDSGFNACSDIPFHGAAPGVYMMDFK